MGNIKNTKTISRKARLELVEVMRPQYQSAQWTDKMKILDGLVAATSYQRKYATRLLNKSTEERDTFPTNKLPIPRIYDDQAKNSLDVDMVLSKSNLLKTISSLLTGFY